MISTILGAFRVGEIRKKLLFTARSSPSTGSGRTSRRRGSTRTAVNAIQKNFGGNSILGLLNLFSGGGLGRIAIFALGIMPYITASIILQLLQVVVPSLEKLSKEGEVGQARITQYTRYLTVGLAFAQSIGYVFLFRSFEKSGRHDADPQLHPGQGLPDRDLADRGHRAADVDGRADHPARHRQRHLAADLRQRSSRGSPAACSSWWNNPDQVFKVMMPFIAIGVVAAVVFVQEGQRRIPIQYAKRVIGRRMTQGGQTYLPLRVNMAGVIPVIFAASRDGDPADGRPAHRPEPQGLRHRPGQLLQPAGLALRARREHPDHPVHLLLHRGDVQPRRPGRQPARSTAASSPG